MEMKLTASKNKSNKLKNSQH